MRDATCRPRQHYRLFCWVLLHELSAAVGLQSLLGLQREGRGALFCDDFSDRVQCEEKHTDKGECS